MTNIYAQPAADLTAVIQGRAKIPKSVIVVQILAALMLAFFCFGLTQFLYAVMSTQMTLSDARAGVFHVPGLCIFMALLALMLVGIYRRSKMGRILGIVYLILFGTPVYMLCMQTLLRPFPESARLVGLLIAIIGMLSALAYWIYAFGFSERARLYFGATQSTPDRPSMASLSCPTRPLPLDPP